MANTVNTTAIGDDFERRSLTIIQKAIEDKQLGLLADCIKIFQHKEYYSSLRERNIKFDLTIEVWPPGANRYVLIYIIECKNYKTRVPVSKIEDFHSKIQQVSGVNVKGIFISNSPLQGAGYNIARSLGMMYIQAESNNDYKIILHRTSDNTKDNILPTSVSPKGYRYDDEGPALLEKIIDEVILNIFDPIKNNNSVSYNIDKLSKTDIANIVNAELDKIDTKINNGIHFITRNKLQTYIKEYYGINLVSKPSSLEGWCDFERNEIGININISGSNRELFILGHELGHYILHQRLSIGQEAYDYFGDSKFDFSINKHKLNNPRDWIEWQANYFSSSLILPDNSFKFRLYKVQDQLGISKGKIYLDDQITNIKKLNQIVDKLSYIFDVTKTSIIIKLNELNLLSNHSRLKTINQIISENFEFLL